VQIRARQIAIAQERVDSIIRDFKFTSDSSATVDLERARKREFLRNFEDES
jgi:hypothetical protein